VPLLWTVAAALGALPSTMSSMRRRRACDGGRLRRPVPRSRDFCLRVPLVRFLYMAPAAWRGRFRHWCSAWARPTCCRCWPPRAAARGSGHGGSGCVRGVRRLLTLSLPTYSVDWPERINVEYWLDADTGQSQFLVRCNSKRLPAASPPPRTLTPCASGLRGRRIAGFPRRRAETRTRRAGTTADRATCRGIKSGGLCHPLRSSATLSARRAEARVVFPASAHVADITLVTAAGRYAPS